MSGFGLFDDISHRVQAGALPAEEAVNQITSINFLEFDIDQIKSVQDAAWLPDDVAVRIMKQWMRRQDEVLLKLRAHLVVTPTITKDQLLEFTQAVRNPSHEPNLIVENIIRRLATAGGTREPINPLTEKLISASASSEYSEHRLADLFSFEPGKYFMSQSTGAQSVIISLPPFLKVQVVAYKLRAPPREPTKKAQGGIQSWHLQASDDPKNFSVDLDTQRDNKDLLTADSEKVFVIAPNDGFYRHFRLMQDGANHQNNNSILLAEFDLTGRLIICRE